MRGWAGQEQKPSLKPSMCPQLCGLHFIQSTTEHSGVLFVLSLCLVNSHLSHAQTRAQPSFKILRVCLFPSGLPVAPLPSLEWPLPSQCGQYELLIQQQPKSHHRAHYETEGSRGAIKTSNGGHPEVQVLLFFVLYLEGVKCTWRKRKKLHFTACFVQEK